MQNPTPQQFLDAVRAAYDQGRSVELSADVPEDAGPATTFKLSILAVTPDGQIVVELPTQPEAATELSRDTVANLLLTEGIGRVVGSCRVTGVEYYQLNASRRVRAIRLARPHRVASAQRRGFFRVQAIGTIDQPVVLRPRGPRGAGAAVACKARLHNLSGGGFGLTVDRRPQVVKLLRSSQMFEATLPLPCGDPLPVQCRLVHLQADSEHTIYLGFELDLDDAADRRAIEDRIVRATTELQRLQLRRKRGA